MAIERTLSILKPDAVKKGLIGACLSKLESAGLEIIALRRTRLTVEQARAFYAVHKARPFYPSLVEFMSSGPVVVSVLQGESAIATNRKVMGATDPAKADAGTIRKLYATNIERNSIHGSDGPETAAFEISYFFSQLEIV